ncbi:5-methyltetrahydrofolate--homocysteine methyltransferase [Breznakia blatticola]|uniref:5-methyltetrahydrofolate--homocysteine methyltransferase n=1 Tax=Breznakia blatticola TaxID=1754012 RepID=A0A4R8A6P0_9FIRM|nr:vitamin B12 dependent-methionine synthase activation domain-containing protein [Breznakia blatticola]TDW26315.1 5-methyltetrahydrofolate--homocysteine methyltransferase [Breznakia blatticola]
MIKQTALKYLGYSNQELSDSFLELLDTCEKEVKELSHFKATYVISKLQAPFILTAFDLRVDSNDLIEALGSCKEIAIIACTLGSEIDSRTRYYHSLDMQKAVVFDAVASAYVEACCDAYEDEVFGKNHSFRYAPGYGDIPLELNQQLCKLMNLHKKIGVSLDASSLFVPMKSMTGFVGLHMDKQKKSCKSCTQKEHCEYLKRGSTCY